MTQKETNYKTEKFWRYMTKNIKLLKTVDIHYELIKYKTDSNYENK